MKKSIKFGLGVGLIALSIIYLVTVILTGKFVDQQTQQLDPFHLAENSNGLISLNNIHLNQGFFIRAGTAELSLSLPQQATQILPLQFTIYQYPTLTSLVHANFSLDAPLKSPIERIMHQLNMLHLFTGELSRGYTKSFSETLVIPPLQGQINHTEIKWQGAHFSVRSEGEDMLQTHSEAIFTPLETKDLLLERSLDMGVMTASAVSQTSNQNLTGQLKENIQINQILIKKQNNTLLNVQNATINMDANWQLSTNPTSSFIAIHRLDWQINLTQPNGTIKAHLDGNVPLTADQAHSLKYPSAALLGTVLPHSTIHLNASLPSSILNQFPLIATFSQTYGQMDGDNVKFFVSIDRGELSVNGQSMNQ